MSRVKAFSRGFFQGRWYEPFVCEYDASGRVIDVGEERDEGIEIDPRVWIQSLPNGHSHCFQFAILGLTEFVERGGDDFWAWRKALFDCTGGTITSNIIQV